MKTERKRNIEYLRAISCIMIILLHTNAWCFDIDQLTGSGRCFYTAVNVLVRFAVPCFMMITGTFLFDQYDKKGIAKFYKNAFSNVLIPTVFFSVLYVLYRCTKGYILLHFSGIDFTFSSVLLDWAKGMPFGHLWYSYMLLGIYFFIPGLCWIRKNIPSSLWLALGIFSVAVSALVNQESLLFPAWPICWIQYVGYFILADCAGGGRAKPHHGTKRFILIAAVIYIIMFVIAICQLNHKNTVMDFQPQNILTFGYSFCIYMYFMGFFGVKQNKILDAIAAHSANIYYMHGLIVNAFQIIMDKLMWQYEFQILFIIISVAINAVCCCTFSKIITIIRSRRQLNDT